MKFLTFKQFQMNFVTINYDIDKADKVTYFSVQLSYDEDKKIKMFDTGDFIKDWFDLIKFLAFETKGRTNFSSSVDHFIMDSGIYDCAYMVFEDGEAQLSYGYVEDAIEIFVPENTQPTWSELKQKYKNGNY